MKIKLIDFGYENAPYRAHENDAGADVYALGNYVISANKTVKCPLGFGLELPDGYAAYVFPRSGLSSKGIVCQIPPVDSGYKGEVHAIVSNLTDSTYVIHKGDRIGQIVITPIVVADFITSDIKQRAAKGFGSTGD